jgi:hypothetical protein
MFSEPTESARVHFIDAPHGLIVAERGARIKPAASGRSFAETTLRLDFLPKLAYYRAATRRIRSPNVSSRLSPPPSDTDPKEIFVNMKSKSSLIIFSIMMAIALAGCSKKSSSNANANSNLSNSNTTATTELENGNNEETQATTDDSSATPSTTKSRNTAKTTVVEKSVNANTTAIKRAPDKEPPLKSTEKQIRKQGDRALRDTGGLIREGERNVRGILNGRP